MTGRSERAPRVGVVVAARNEAARLPWLFDSLAEQTLDQDEFEVIVVDDGSSDRTAELVAATESATLVSAHEHVGLAAARNLGVAAAAAPVIAFTDADCRPTPAWLERGLAAFERSECDILAGGITITIHRPTVSALIDAASFLDQERYVERGFAAGANLWLRKRLIVELGGFDERLGLYGEEEELCQRAVRRGARIAYAPDALVEHPARSAARQVVRKAFLLGYGLAVHRRFNEGTLGGIKPLFTQPKQFLPRRRVRGVDRLRRRGIELTLRQLVGMYVAQHLYVAAPRIAGDVAGELRMLIRAPRGTRGSALDLNGTTDTKA